MTLKDSDVRWLAAKIRRFLNQLTKTTFKADHLLDVETKIVKRYQVLAERLNDDRLPTVAVIKKIDANVVRYQLQNQQQIVTIPQSLLNVVARKNRQPETLCWFIVDNEPLIGTIDWLRSTVRPVLQQYLNVFTNGHPTDQLLSDDGIYLPSDTDPERDW